MIYGMRVAAVSLLLRLFAFARQRVLVVVLQKPEHLRRGGATARPFLRQLCVEICSYVYIMLSVSI